MNIHLYLINSKIHRNPPLKYALIVAKSRYCNGIVNTKMIQAYFKLQIKRGNRYIREFGLHPMLGYVLGLLAFLAGSEYLFYKTSYAHYIYLGIALLLYAWIESPDSIQFYKTIFNIQQYRALRIVECLILYIPFGIFLIYKGYSSIALIGYIVVFVIALLPPIQFKSRNIPTPFTYQPFEFSMGIRNSYWFYFSLYFILSMAIQVDNFNLGIATQVLTFILSFTFYSTLENEIYIWNYQGKPQSFLINKMWTAIMHVTLLSSPIVILLLYFWPSQYIFIIGLQLLGYIYLITFICAKYAAYPRLMSLPQGLILVFCLWIPPLLIIIIPYLFMQSNRKLKSILQ